MRLSSFMFSLFLAVCIRIASLVGKPLGSNRIYWKSLFTSLVFDMVLSGIYHIVLTHASSIKAGSFVIKLNFSVAACAAKNLSKGSRCAHSILPARCA